VIVKAWLEGHQLDLEILTEMLPTGDTRVIKTDSGYYQTAAEIDDRPTGVPFYEVAPRVLQRVNRLARVLDTGFRPVRLSGRYQEGDRVHQVVQVHPAVMRMRAMPVRVAIGGRPVEPPPPPGPGYAKIAIANVDLSEALDIMGRPEPPTWVELYKVYEIVENTGTLKAAMTASGISSNQLSLFRQTACHPDAAGRDARHGRSKQEPPEKPMSLATARATIADLLRGWMDSASRP
jgi:hypothetical protein